MAEADDARSASSSGGSARSAPVTPPAPAEAWAQAHELGEDHGGAARRALNLTTTHSSASASSRASPQSSSGGGDVGVLQRVLSWISPTQQPRQQSPPGRAWEAWASPPLSQQQRQQAASPSESAAVMSATLLHRLLAKEQSLRQQLPAKLHALRLQRQWGALRAERCLTQLLLALVRVQVQLVQARTCPGAAPAPSRGKTDACGHASWIAGLEQQQQALRLRCLAATKVRDDELRAAAALSKRSERRRQLAEVLRRTVVLYEAGAARLHAPIDKEQAGFERVVCSPHARESRLVWRWVSLFEQRCAAQAASPPSAAAVADFCGYVGRLVAAEYGFAAEALPSLQLFASRLLLPLLQDCLFAFDLQRCAQTDAYLQAQQRWMQAIPPTRLGVEPRFCGDRGGDDGGGGDGGGGDGGGGDGGGGGGGRPATEHADWRD